MPRRAERTTPSTPLHLPLPSLSALIQAINSHREIPSIIHALTPMTRLSLATPVNAVPSTDYYSSLQSFTRWPSCPYMSENSHRVGLGRPRGWYREHNEIDFLSMPKEGPPDLQRSGISCVHLIYYHEHIIFAAQHDTTLLQCSCKLMQKKLKNPIGLLSNEIPRQCSRTRRSERIPRCPDLYKIPLTTTPPSRVRKTRTTTYLPT
jgi:hypothetical protein